MLVQGHRGIGLQQLPVYGAQDTHIVVGTWKDFTNEEQKSGGLVGTKKTHVNSTITVVSKVNRVAAYHKK